MKDAVKAICRIWRPEWQGMLMGRLTYKKRNGENKAYEEIIRDGKLLRVAVRGRKSGEFLELILSKPSVPKKERSGPMKPPSGNHFQQMKSELTAKRLATIMKSITQRNPSSADFRFLNP